MQPINLPAGLLNFAGAVDLPSIQIATLETGGLALTILTILALTVLIARFVKSVMNTFFVKTSHNTHIDRTQFIILERLVIAIIYFVGIVIAASRIPGFEAAGVSLLAGAGVFAAILGFGAQKAFSNLVSGLFIAMFKPFRVGDRIEFQGKVGKVEDINLRQTMIKNFEGNRIIVPNAVIADEVITNYTITDPRVLSTMEIGISYDSSIDLARKIMVEEAIKHRLVIKNHPESNLMPAGSVALVKVMGFADSSITLRLYFWSVDKLDSFLTTADLYESIKKRFDKEGVEIPFPYRTIVYKKEMLANPAYDGQPQEKGLPETKRKKRDPKNDF